MNSPTCIRTSVISPLEIFTERSANCIVTQVRRRSPNQSYWYMKKESKLILAPRSNNAQFIMVCPMMHEMVGLPGSLYFTGMGPINNSLMLDARNTSLGTFVFLFLVHMSFKKLVYDGTYCMASRRGTFIWTWLNIFLIFSIWALVLLVASLLGNGTIGLWVCSSILSF